MRRPKLLFKRGDGALMTGNGFKMLTQRALDCAQAALHLCALQRRMRADLFQERHRMLLMRQRFCASALRKT